MAAILASREQALTVHTLEEPGHILLAATRNGVSILTKGFQMSLPAFPHLMGQHQTHTLSCK